PSEEDSVEGDWFEDGALEGEAAGYGAAGSEAPDSTLPPPLAPRAGAPASALPPPVQLLLPSDASPYEQVHPDRRAAMRRSSTLAALASGQPFSFLVTSAAALLRRVVPPEPLRAASIELRREM